LVFIPERLSSIYCSANVTKLRQIHLIQADINVVNKVLRREWEWQEAGEDCIMRSFITCALYQILFG
jgi:hypothetical protein